jgi:hypothetical protein
VLRSEFVVGETYKTRQVIELLYRASFLAAADHQREPTVILRPHPLNPISGSDPDLLPVFYPIVRRVATTAELEGHSFHGRFQSYVPRNLFSERVPFFSILFSV